MIRAEISHSASYRIGPLFAAGGLAAGLLSAGLALPTGRASPFRAPRIVSMGSDHQPSALAAADIDGDGKLDLLVGSDGAEDVTVFRGDGRGGFTRDRSFPAGPSPSQIAVADLNGDGKLDLAIANHGTPQVTILLGDGRGGFRPAEGSPMAVHSHPHPHTIGVCDVDGDGKPDLVIDSWGENRFTVLRGLGNGRFSVPGETVEAGRKPYRNLLLRDVTGDGLCDIVAPNMVERAITVLSGDGHGHFTGAAAPPTPAGPCPFAIAAGDFNHDGNVDIAVANYSGHIVDASADALTFLLGDGHGHFRLGARIPTGRAPGDVATGDVDGDGFADAVTVNAGTHDLTVAFGGPDGLSPSRTGTVPYGGGAAWRVLLADFDGDGRADAVTANGESHSISILLTR